MDIKNLDRVSKIDERRKMLLQMLNDIPNMGVATKISVGLNSVDYNWDKLRVILEEDLESCVVKLRDLGVEV